MLLRLHKDKKKTLLTQYSQLLKNVFVQVVLYSSSYVKSTYKTKKITFSLKIINLGKLKPLFLNIIKFCYFSYLIVSLLCTIEKLYSSHNPLRICFTILKKVNVFCKLSSSYLFLHLIHLTIIRAFHESIFDQSSSKCWIIAKKLR